MKIKIQRCWVPKFGYSFLLALMFAAGQVQAANDKPTIAVGIAGVIVSFDAINGDVLTIYGKEFDTGWPLIVTLGDLGELEVVSFSEDTIEARCPLMATNYVCPEGDYRLTVTTGPGDVRTESYDLTIGAVGPAGEQGLPGEMGPPGEPGPGGSRLWYVERSQYYDLGPNQEVCGNPACAGGYVTGGGYHLHRASTNLPHFVRQDRLDTRTKWLVCVRHPGTSVSSEHITGYLFSYAICMP